MGIPEWMLSVDSRKITVLHNGACVQMLMHFKGALAHQMEQDLSRLIAGGRLETATLNIVGYTMPKRKKVLAYRACGVRDPNEKSGNFSLLLFSTFQANNMKFDDFRAENSIWRKFYRRKHRKYSHCNQFNTFAGRNCSVFPNLYINVVQFNMNCLTDRGFKIL